MQLLIKKNKLTAAIRHRAERLTTSGGAPADPHVTIAGDLRAQPGSVSAQRPRSPVKWDGGHRVSAGSLLVAGPPAVSSPGNGETGKGKRKEYPDGYVKKSARGDFRRDPTRRRMLPCPALRGMLRCPSFLPSSHRIPPHPVWLFVPFVSVARVRTCLLGFVPRRGGNMQLPRSAHARAKAAMQPSHRRRIFNRASARKST